MLKENNHFKIKVKSLLEENEELREKLEQRESHQNALIRSHSKALSEYSAKIAALEVFIFQFKNILHGIFSYSEFII